MDPKLMQFIDAERFPAVFSTEELLSQGDLPVERRCYRKGDIIFQAGERHPFTYHVGSGIVRLYLSSPEGTVKTLFYHAAGTQFAFQGFKRDRMTRSTAVAVTDCELYAVDYADLIAFCDDHTEYYMAYIEYLFHHELADRRDCESVVSDGTPSRGAAFICADLRREPGSAVLY